jgi:histone deacetylase 11
MSILGIENFHPFDSKKFKKVYKNLILKSKFCPQQFYTPPRATDEELLSVHTPEYLKSLKKSSVIANNIEIPPLKIVPSIFLRNSILEPMRLATGGTILGISLALRYGWAINLSGGYHHAKADMGEGFCFFSDVPIALKSIWKSKPDLKVLLVDLDAHQGNGFSSVLAKEPRIAILDMYNDFIYPQDRLAAQFVKYPVALQRRTNTSDYLDSLKKWLPIAIENESPNLIIYNAGTDIYLADALGNLSVTRQGIIDRDNFVFESAIEKKIPFLMVLSGGYHKDSGGIIAESIGSFLENGIVKINANER